MSRACPHPFPVATATPVGHHLSYQEEILDSRRRLEPFFAPEQAGTAFAATSRVSSTVTRHGSGYLNYEQDSKLLLCCIASRLRPTGRVDGFCDKFAWPFYAVVSFQVPILTLLPMQMTLSGDVFGAAHHFQTTTPRVFPHRTESKLSVAVFSLIAFASSQDDSK